MVFAVIAALGLAIFVHELGHFFAARWAGARVNRFAVGFGRPLIAFRRGDTEYQICRLPFGGLVEIEGMDPEDASRGSHTYASKSIGKRAVIVAAGVVVNFLCAVLLFAAIPAIYGTARGPEAIVGVVAADRLPEGAHGWEQLRGERVLAVNGSPVDSWFALLDKITETDARDLTLSLAGGGEVSVGMPAGADERSALARAIGLGGPARIGLVNQGSAAAAAGLQRGDVILAVDGVGIQTYGEFHHATGLWSDGSTAVLTVRRGAHEFATEIVPTPTEGGLSPWTTGVLPSFQRSRVALLPSLAFGVSNSVDVVGQIVRFLGRVARGDFGLRGIGGPVTVVNAGTAVSAHGPDFFLAFVAFLSLNLAVVNMLPIPMLDGGHLLFLALERLRGRPLGRKARSRIVFVGGAILAVLMAIGLMNDLGVVARLLGL
jgi:regulator of sigma E protease